MREALRVHSRQSGSLRPPEHPGPGEAAWPWAERGRRSVVSCLPGRPASPPHETLLCEGFTARQSFNTKHFLRGIIHIK